MVGVEPAPDGGVYVHGLTLEGERLGREGLGSAHRGRCCTGGAACARLRAALASVPAAQHAASVEIKRRPFPTNPPRSGARWDAEEGCLVDSLPNQLRQAMPPLLIRPVTSDQYAAALAAGDLYLCPVYVNMQRANVRVLKGGGG